MPKKYNGRVNNSNEILAEYFERNPNEQVSVIELSRRLNLTDGSIRTLLSDAFNHGGVIRGTSTKLTRINPIGTTFVYKKVTE